MLYSFLGIGFVLLVVGSEAVLRGGAGLMRALGLPPFFSGLFVASLAMSAPELSIAAQATARNAPDIALGCIIGGSIANMLLVFGLGALLRPMPAPPRTVFRDGGALVAAGVVLVILLLCDFVVRPMGAALLAGWLAYLALVYVTDWGRAGASFPLPSGGSAAGGGLGIFLLPFGIACLFFGARFAIDFALVMARDFHLPVAAVALTVLALGTSLPEIVTTMRSAAHGHPGQIASQLIASSIFNILLVLGTAALIRPMTVAPMLAQFDGPIAAACAVLLALLMLSGWRLTRGQGVLLLVGYAAYLVSVGLRAGLHIR